MFLTLSSLIGQKTNADIILGKCHTRMQCASVSVLQLMYDVLTHQINVQQFQFYGINFNNKENLPNINF